MKDHRMLDQNDRPIDFTCQNAKYETNINKGEPHGQGQALGSVFPQSLIGKEESSLWLEHVVNRETREELYWLMWYKKVVPAIPLSSVFTKSDLEVFAQQMARFVP